MLISLRALSKITLAIAVLVVMAAIIPSGGMIWADSATQAVAQGYSSDSPLQPGMIVRLDTKDPSKVLPLDMNNISKMLGVVVSASQATITLGSNNSNNQVFVTNYGRHDVLISDQNGPIKVGDYVTISNIAGIGMKADSGQSLVLGQAAGSFDGSANVVGSSVLSGSNGQKSTVNIGEVPVDISITMNPLSEGPKGLPAFLRKVTRFATNKSVSATRVYLSLFIILAGVVLTITIIYSGIKNGIISIGRNPLAKKTISVNLVKIVAIGIIIFAISLGGAYAVLL